MIRLSDVSRSVMVTHTKKYRVGTPMWAGDGEFVVVTEHERGLIRRVYFKTPKDYENFVEELASHSERAYLPDCCLYGDYAEAADAVVDRILEKSKVEWGQ